MSELIRATTPTDGWLQGMRHLQKRYEWREYNLILEITRPMALSATDKQIAIEVGKFLESHKKQPISTVIGTIFPASLNNGQAADALINEYLKIAPDLCQHPDNKKWGTYFLRLASKSDGKGKEVRPLERLIERLAKQAKAGSPKRAWYELNFADPFLELSIYDNLSDPRWMMGGPCLSHVSFKLKPDQSLVMTALYRSHYYVERTLGNLYGLAMLQDFVAKQAGIESAELVCHSTMAQIDHKDYGKEAINILMEKCSTLSESNLTE